MHSLLDLGICALLPSCFPGGTLANQASTSERNPHEDLGLLWLQRRAPEVEPADDEGELQALLSGAADSIRNADAELNEVPLGPSPLLTA